MAILSPSSENPQFRQPRRWRWLVLLAASVLLHVIAFNWASGRIGMPSWRDQSPTVITTQLQSIAPAEESPAKIQPVSKPAAPKRKRKPKPRKASPPPAPPIVESAPPLAPAGMEVPVAGVETATATETAVETVAETATETAAAEPSSLGADPADATHASADAPNVEEQERYKVIPPPSAELEYDVQALREGQTVYGYGEIHWQVAENNYTITGEAGVLFFTLLNFRSEGMIDDFGVAPVIYSEKKRRRSETNTHFHRERNEISFSASTRSYPRKGGEQDRASVVWQLAGIGRGNSEKFAPDAEIDLFVAGVRDAETWRIRVIGMEEIEVGIGKVSAWHVVRIPRPGTYDQKLDIWLAPQQEWFPVKLRYTETNGDYLDMSLSKMHFATSP